MEDAVYLCSWSRSRKGFALWMKARPKVRVSAPTFDEAQDLLFGAILDAGGAMQPVMVFDPPMPKTSAEKKYTSPELYLICGDDRFETDAPRRSAFDTVRDVEKRLRWLDAFYGQPVCRTCKHTSGRRNDKLMTFTYPPTKYDGAFGSIGHDGGPNHQIVSEEFVALLTPEEKRRLKFQSTVRKRGRKFFELVGPEGPPYVAVAGLKNAGWHCTRCDHSTWGYWIDGLAMSSFLASSDLPSKLPGLFTVGSFPEIELAVSAARWKELVGKKGTRGFVNKPLGVVPDREVVRHPKLPTLE
jgi:hypothetical protein